MINIPKNCPICNKPLINYFYNIYSRELLIKECYGKNHKLHFDINAFNEILSIYLIFDPIKKISVVWKIEEKILEIVNWDKDESDIVKSVQITYFEPDFSNYNKLINKIKTYMTFS